MDKILSGKPIAERIRSFVKDSISQRELSPRMLLIQVAGDSASDYYVKNIVKTGSKLGIEVILKQLDQGSSQQTLLELIEQANQDDNVHGIMVQEPLPPHIDANLVGAAVAAHKDIDSLNPINHGRIVMGINGLTPCTPTAVYALLCYYKIPVQGKHMVIIGRSPVVGKPLANMMLWKTPFADATVSVVHSRSTQLTELTRQADIVVAALGKAGFVTQEMIKKNAVLIDVGINEVPGSQGKPVYVGDIDYNSCFDKAQAITPVPGGIGTVTSSLLFLNLLRAQLGTGQANKSLDCFLGLIFDVNHNE